MELLLRRALLPLIAAALLAGRAAAQDQVIVIEGGEGVVVEDGGPPPEMLAAMQAAQAGAAGTNAPSAELRQLLQLRLDRRPEMLLETLSRSFTATGEVTNRVERFRLDVIRGDWPAVGSSLAAMPTNEAAQVYDHLLRTLMMPPGRGGPGGEGGPPQGPQQGPPPMHFLLPGDVLALADAAPAELTEARLTQLGTLLGRTLERGAPAGPLVRQLATGTARLGGDDPARRAAAARLLIAAGRPKEAADFLPPLEASRATNDFATLNLHAARLAGGQAGHESDDPAKARAARHAALDSSWELTQFLLLATNAPAAERQKALHRALDLLPKLQREAGSNWLRTTFAGQPALGLAILAEAGRVAAQGPAQRPADARAAALRVQRRAVDGLLAVGQPAASWRLPLNALAATWLREAELTRRRGDEPPPQQPQFDQFGNQIYYGPQPGFRDPSQPEPVEAAVLLETAPEGGWLVQLDPAVAPRVRVVRVPLLAQEERFADALAALALVAKDDPDAGRLLAGDCLSAWARRRSPSQNQFQPRYYGPYYNPYQQMGGIALTRARQERNLDELAGFLPALNRLPKPPAKEVLVTAFTGAHSAAEVFRVEDIERVFGPVDGLDGPLLAGLIQTMRERLAGQWRQPRVQQDAKTKRTDKEISAQVARGYALLAGLAEAAERRAPDDWSATLARAATLFDSAEFDYGQKVDLAVYTAKRDEAFRHFARAAELYAAKLPALDEPEETTRVFEQWFSATLGASDLAYLTRQTEPSTNQLGRIRAAMAGLPDGAAARHRTAFARGLSERSQGLRPELKPRYLRAGLEIAGDDPAAAEARKLVRYYDDLLRELVLDVRVDGDAAVGHGRPFGVFVSLLHTDAVGRESGGFAKYLQNQGNQGYYFNPYGGGPVNYRDDFEKQVREKFSDSFEVVAVTFHEDKVEPRGTDRPGWREFPYAYLLLKAKDASADTLPALQLNMDFVDSAGQVVLPVSSAPVLVDARPEPPPARPARQIELTQMLDDRELGAGRATLEIKATARGLVPELSGLVDVAFSGFTVTNVDDRGVVLTQMDTEGDAVAPVSERVWLLSLTPTAGAAGGSLAFAFPQPRQADTKATYKRYADADLVEVPAEIAVAGVPLQRGWWWLWALGGVGLGAAAFLVWLRMRPAAAEAVAAPAYTVPGEVTPFSVIRLLRRMEADGRLPLSDGQRRDLGASIADLQRRYFAPGAETDHEADLRALAERWVTATR